MERPILFSTPMVQAIIALIKRMTRRTKGLKKVNEKPEEWEINGSWHDFNGKFAVEFRHKQTGEFVLIECPYGKLGDILWVRETWQQLPSGFDEMPPEDWFIYKASDKLSEECTKWRPAIHMPRKACRIRLKITDIRVERLHDISEEDAKAEGITSYWAEPHKDVAPFIGAAKELGADLCFTRHEAFQQLWDNINKDRGHGWDQNDWVWVVSFERVK